MDKRDVARVLSEIALLLELKGENVFRVRAFENAARALEGLADDLGVRVEGGTLTEVKGIGGTIARHVAELWTTGRLRYYEELVEATPPGYLDMIRVPGLGAKKVRVLGESLGIVDLGALKRAAQAGTIRSLAGFGPQSEQNILKGIALLEAGAGRYLVSLARPVADGLMATLGAQPAVERIEVGGSLRRWAETVKDVDLLAASRRPADVTRFFLEQVPGASVIASGETKTSVRLPSGLAVDLRVVKPKEFPFALHYFTGSVAHNIRIRARAQERGMSLNEYALSGKRHAPPVADEVALFRLLDLPYIEPELREDRGEIEAAEGGSLPDLIEPDDMKGILHCHTTASDGRASLEEMAEAAQRLGASYLGIADHSVSARYANGLSEADLKRQGAAIDKWNATSRRLRILKGAEVDILPDGSLDYPDRVLERLDYVVASVHTNFGQDEATMTRRIVKALRNRHVSILAHPTGRLLLKREGYRVRLEEVFTVAADEGVVLEINADPNRLDLDWRELRTAKARGARFAINPDAHDPNGYANIRFGVGIARKGWLTRADVVNTLSVAKLLRIFEARR